MDTIHQLVLFPKIEFLTVCKIIRDSCSQVGHVKAQPTCLSSSSKPRLLSCHWQAASRAAISGGGQPSFQHNQVGSEPPQVQARPRALFLSSGISISPTLREGRCSSHHRVVRTFEIHFQLCVPVATRAPSQALGGTQCQETTHYTFQELLLMSSLTRREQGLVQT